LFEWKSGFSEHYASAFAVLARMSGIPERGVLGFHGGEVSAYDCTLIVRDCNALACVVVPVASRGGVRIVPTASVDLGRLVVDRIGESLTGNLSRASVFGKIYYSVGMAWDAVNHQYTQFIMNYSSDEIVEGLE